MSLRINQALEHTAEEILPFYLETGMNLEFASFYANRSIGASERLIQEL